jgi:Flp pilus assembly protein TadD
MLGRIYHTTDRDKEAVDLFKKVISLNPEFYSAYMDLRLVYERLGEKKKYDELLQTSLKVYPQYLSQHPDDARARMFFATDLAQMDRTEEAKAEAAKALELNPNDPLMLYNAACFYSRSKEKHLAVKSLKGAVAAGYQDYEWVKRDPDLENIRHEPEFLEFMKGK